MNFRTGFQHKKYSSKGCLLVYETDGVAVSFLSNAHWETPEIEGTYIELLDDGDLKQCQVSIPNVSYKDNVIIFKEYYEKKKMNIHFNFLTGKYRYFLGIYDTPEDMPDESFLSCSGEKKDLYRA